MSQEEIKDEKVEVKTYSQEEFDNAIASAKKRVETKIERDYVSKADYDALKQQYTQLEHLTKDASIRNAFEKAGGRVDAYNDFIKLNANLYDVDSKELDSKISEVSKQSPYLFKTQEFHATVSENVEQAKPKNSGISF